MNSSRQLVSLRTESFASLAAWLASDLAADVNGAAIPIYGRG